MLRNAFLVLLFACNSAYHFPGPVAPRNEIEQEKDTARILATCISEGSYPDISSGLGSGIVLDSQHILTAAHVVACSYSSNIVAQVDGKTLKMIPERVSAEWDLAVIVSASLDGFGKRSAPIIGEAKIGEQVCSSVAVPEPGHNCGTVTETNKESHGWDVTVDAVVEHGNSGGGVYNDKGELVGVVTKLITCEGVPCGGRFQSLLGNTFYKAL